MAFHQRRWPTPFLMRCRADAAGRIDQLSIPLQEGAPEIVFARAGDTP